MEENPIQLWTDIMADFKENGVPYNSEPLYYFQSSDDMHIKPHDDHDGELLKYLVSGPCIRGTDIPKGNITLSIPAFLKYMKISVDAADLFPKLDLRERYIGEKQEPRNELRINVDSNKIDVELYIFDTNPNDTDVKTINDYFLKYGVPVNLTQNDKEAGMREFNNGYSITSIMKRIYNSIISG